MLQIVLLAGKFLFLIVLYLFVFTVVRSATRELRSAAPAPMPRAFPPAMAPAPSQYRPDPAATVAAPSLAAPSLAPPAPIASHGGTTALSAPLTQTATAPWLLVVETGPRLRPGHAFPLWEGHTAIAGRIPEAEIYLDDTFVSSKHALFEVTAAGPIVEDFGSTNGTQVNGRDVAGRYLLHAGDRVEIGDSVFRVEARR